MMEIIKLVEDQLGEVEIVRIENLRKKYFCLKGTITIFQRIDGYFYYSSQKVIEDALFLLNSQEEEPLVVPVTSFPPINDKEEIPIVTREILFKYLEEIGEEYYPPLIDLDFQVDYLGDSFIPYQSFTFKLYNDIYKVYLVQGKLFGMPSTIRIFWNRFLSFWRKSVTMSTQDV